MLSKDENLYVIITKIKAAERIIFMLSAESIHAGNSPYSPLATDFLFLLHKIFAYIDKRYYFCTRKINYPFYFCRAFSSVG